MKHLWRYIFILLGAVILWNQFLFRPLRILSIFFHKIGHAIGAFAFGHGQDAFTTTFGSLADVTIDGRGLFSSLVILNGGYIASGLFSVLLLGLKKTRAKSFLLGFTAIFFMMASVINTNLQFTWIYAVFYVSAIIILYMIRNDSIDEWVIDIVGISTITYITYDTFVNTILLKINSMLNIVNNWESSVPNDIAKLGELTFLPDIVWAIIWLLITILIFNFVLIKPSKGRRR
ncbi:UNVERIFIED_CONTAM: peptidase M50B-like protein [Acetivibrio alkalicellulosi]